MKAMILSLTLLGLSTAALAGDGDGSGQTTTPPKDSGRVIFTTCHPTIQCSLPGWVPTCDIFGHEYCVMSPDGNNGGSGGGNP